VGVEPTLPPWQGSRLPLHHGRLFGYQIVKDHQSTGPDSNRRRRITGAESSPLDDQCLLSVGPEGLEPSPAWVRTRDATANTSIPFVCFQSARWELNPRPASYKDAALTIELRAGESRAGGNRTHSGRLKVCCAAFTPRPYELVGRMRFNR
jgi:hypothetical protein